MIRTVTATAALALLLTAVSAVDAGDKAEAQKPRQKPQALLGLDAASFIKRFDKDNDGLLTKEELPERLAQFFQRADANKDGKLDAEEVERMLQILRRRMVQAGKPDGSKPEANKPGAGKPDGGRFVSMMMERLDADRDGKISKAEARGPLKENFDRLDLNKDGFLDKEELQRAAGRLQALRARMESGDPPRRGGERGKADFTDFDQNADGRLTRDELKGTPFEAQFEAIDLNKDGRIDRKEWTAFQKKGPEKETKKE